MYGRVPTVDDLQIGNSRSLAFKVQDDSGRMIRVVQRMKAPYRVYARHLDVDLYVFASVQSDLKEWNIAGWLTRDEVEQAPIFWFEEEKNGEKIKSDYCHEVDSHTLIAMPETFNFEESCEHANLYGLLWDYTSETWECTGCGRFLFDNESRDSIRRYDKLHDWRSPKVPA